MTTDPTSARARLHDLRLYLASALALTYVVAWWSVAPTEAPAPSATTTANPTTTAPTSPRAAATPAPRVRRVASPSRRVRTRSS